MESCDGFNWTGVRWAEQTLEIYSFSHFVISLTCYLPTQCNMYKVYFYVLLWYWWPWLSAIKSLLKLKSFFFCWLYFINKTCQNRDFRNSLLYLSYQKKASESRLLRHFCACSTPTHSTCGSYCNFAANLLELRENT